MRRMVASLLRVVATLLLAADAGAPTAVQYGPLHDEAADICRPDLAAGPRPGVLLIHGGGWVGGDKATNGERCRDLAQAGLTVMNINYRLADGTPQHAWPAALDDAHLALAWMRRNARTIGLDRQRIAVVGDSVGGQLAVFLGADGRGSGIRCVIEESGPVDLPTAPSFTAAVSPSVFPAQPLAAAYRSASPIFAITKDTVPILIVHGQDDPLVPFSQAQELLDKLHREDIDAEMVAYRGGHIEQGLTDTEKLRINAVETNYLTACLDTE